MRQLQIVLCDPTGRATLPDAISVHLADAGYTVLAMRAGEAPAAGLVWQVADEPSMRARLIRAGVEDVIGPWMDLDEAVARALRCAQRLSHRPEGRIEIGELAIDLVEGQAVRRGKGLGLLKRELDLLVAFARCPGAILSREQLLRLVWRLSFDPGTNVVQVHMSRLRAKLDSGFDWPMLRTVRGVGYRLVTERACVTA